MFMFLHLLTSFFFIHLRLLHQFTSFPTSLCSCFCVFLSVFHHFPTFICLFLCLLTSFSFLFVYDFYINLLLFQRLYVHVFASSLSLFSNFYMFTFLHLLHHFHLYVTFTSTSSLSDLYIFIFLGLLSFLSISNFWLLPLLQHVNRTFTFVHLCFFCVIFIHFQLFQLVCFKLLSLSHCFCWCIFYIIFIFSRLHVFIFLWLQISSFFLFKSFSYFHDLRFHMKIEKFMFSIWFFFNTCIKCA